MGLKWGARFCPQADFLVKSDDDVILNPAVIRRVLLPVNNATFIGGNCAITVPLHVRDKDKDVDKRDFVVKWGVTRDEYPRDFYPPSCSGLFIAYSREAARRIFSASRLNDYNKRWKRCNMRCKRTLKG